LGRFFSPSFYCCKFLREKIKILKIFAFLILLVFYITKKKKYEQIRKIRVRSEIFSVNTVIINIIYKQI